MRRNIFIIFTITVIVLAVYGWDRLDSALTDPSPIFKSGKTHIGEGGILRVPDVEAGVHGDETE
jgi:hypothetical protein